MTAIQSLEARMALGVAVSAVGLGVAYSKHWVTMTTAAFDRAAVLALIVSRMALFLLVFVIARIAPRGDLPIYYVTQAMEIMAHHLPYRDFDTSYSPLYGFLNAGILHIWFSPLILILFAMLAEFFVVPLWLRTGRLYFTEEQVRLATILYVSSALSVQFVTIDGQNNILLALLIVGATLALARRRDFASGLLIGIGIAVIKFLPIFCIPALFLAARRRAYWTLGLLLPIVPTVIIFSMHHVNVLYPITIEASRHSANNIPFVIGGLMNRTDLPYRLDHLVPIFAPIIVAFVCFWILRAPQEQRVRIATLSSVGITISLMVFAAKSWPDYIVMVLFPMCLVFAVRYGRAKLPLAFFMAGTLIMLAAPSVWSTLFNDMAYLGAQFGADLRGHHPAPYAFLGLQLAVIATYFWLMGSSLLESRNSAYMAPTETKAL